MEISVVIPTHDRRATLGEVLTRLERQEGGVRFEVIVVDDGSTDGTADAVRSRRPTESFELELIEQPCSGPAAARNRGVAAARAPVVLFSNDDTLARPDLVARHATFHARRPEREAALLGAIVLPPRPEPTEFMRWLADNHFDYSGIGDPSDAGGARFFTANVSVKVELLRAAGGFDESFREGANEDVDLGLRLEGLGMRLEYDPLAVTEHDHPIDLGAAIARYRRLARWLVPLVERHPDWPVPRPPGARHRAKAALLTALTAARLRPPAVRREVWRFLCHEAAREGYWEAVREGSGEPAPPGIATSHPPIGGLRIGARLARHAERDPAARLPA